MSLSPCVNKIVRIGGKYYPYPESYTLIREIIEYLKTSDIPSFTEGKLRKRIKAYQKSLNWAMRLLYENGLLTIIDFCQSESNKEQGIKRKIRYKINFDKTINVEDTLKKLIIKNQKEIDFYDESEIMNIE